MRAVANAVDLTIESNELDDKKIRHAVVISAEEPSTAAFGATVLFTVAGTMVDAAAAELFTAEKGGLTLGSEGKSAVGGGLHGADPETLVTDEAEKQVATETQRGATAAGEVTSRSIIEDELKDVAEKAGKGKANLHPQDARYDAEITAEDGHTYHREKGTTTGAEPRLTQNARLCLACLPRLIRKSMPRWRSRESISRKLCLEVPATQRKKGKRHAWLWSVGSRRPTNSILTSRRHSPRRAPKTSSRSRRARAHWQRLRN